MSVLLIAGLAYAGLFLIATLALLVGAHRWGAMLDWPDDDRAG